MLLYDDGSDERSVIILTTIKILVECKILILNADLQSSDRSWCVPAVYIPLTQPMGVSRLKVRPNCRLLAYSPSPIPVKTLLL